MYIEGKNMALFNAMIELAFSGILAAIILLIVIGIIISILSGIVFEIWDFLEKRAKNKKK
jgi:hypothetical protein